MTTEAGAKLCGFHHVAVLTPDLNRLAEFYRTVFGADIVMDASAADPPNVFIDLGNGAVLHAFQLAGAPPGAVPRFARGRLDHFGLHTPTRESFLDLRGRVKAAGAGDGRVRDFGAVWSLAFHDPDGMEGELLWTCDPHREITSPPRVLTDADFLHP
jgi:catechol 2,3-dioxygenase-like lactoylglutathione lyase family enzyme